MERMTFFRMVAMGIGNPEHWGKETVPGDSGEWGTLIALISPRY
jgi:hypothetical protein